VLRFFFKYEHTAISSVLAAASKSSRLSDCCASRAGCAHRSTPLATPTAALALAAALAAALVALALAAALVALALVALALALALVTLRCSVAPS
jgi:hypothetical protein